ncbi:putative MFS family arabinose efflux permease [Lipingzhangella halophila]|uniref:Putative MFS family arabinose efflux permease n=1 Tax=Lipingzhangella halophila TaxID=1783352 RepID=A0A7W7RNU5_9ACTN|nr:MFS transporter [Lipingzhangella halophila]MBB4935391.1 putative MFS family arabinose efflux permease [Lipingzhangella halophila]
MRPLFPLALATFAVGTDAFVIAGLLPAIAADLGVSIPAAGQLVTVFALTLAVAAPILTWLLSPLDRRKALQLALLVFVVGNVVTALSPTYLLALLARTLTALGAATITATASSAAVSITPAERRGRAMALVIGGLTLSTALGMPLGNLIGSVDWRLTLWAVAALGVVAAIGISVSLPKVVLPATSLTARLAPLRQPKVLTILVATLLVMAGHYTVYTYIGAMTTEATTGSFPQALTMILFAWGAGVLVGNFFAGYLVDKRPPLGVAVTALAGGTVFLAISPLTVSHLAIAFVWAAIWGATDGMASVVQQHRLVTFAPASAPVLLGLNSSAIYVGVAVGGALGGLTQDWLPVTLLGVPAAVLALLATTVTVAEGRANRARTSPGTPEYSQ